MKSMNMENIWHLKLLGLIAVTDWLILNLIMTAVLDWKINTIKITLYRMEENNMENKFEHMSNYEIGVIAKAFMCCAECKNCPCDFVLCSVGDTKKAREDFINEFAKRVRE